MESQDFRGTSESEKSNERVADLGRAGFSERDFARFVSKVRKTEGCWLWTAYTTQDGYGQFALNQYPTKAHRLAYRLWVGDIGGLCVCHTCDVRHCVNPGHLFLGSNADNTRDMLEKGRKASTAGEKHGGAKLTTEDVRQIRFRAGLRLPYKLIAQSFGITASTVSQIVNRTKWKHVL